MSEFVYFAFSAGLKKSITVPAGTIQGYLNHVRRIEQGLGLVAEQYKDNPPHWRRPFAFENVPDAYLCREVEEHNEWVREVYDNLAHWQKNPPTGETEELTPEIAAQFWHGLEMLSVPVHRWSRDYYTSRMHAVFDVMTRGENSEGVRFDTRKLTPKQAVAVIRLFEPFLDRHDVRLEVPNGYDFLTENYDWCEKCGPVFADDYNCKRRKCPLREEGLRD